MTRRKNNVAAIAAKAVKATAELTRVGIQSLAERVENAKQAIGPVRWAKDKNGKPVMAPATLSRYNTWKEQHSIGFLAAREGITIAEAAKIIALPNSNAKAKGPKRTAEQDKILAAARKDQQRIRDDAGIKSPAKNSGSNNGAGKRKQAKPEPKPEIVGKDDARVKADKPKDAAAIRHHVGQQTAAIFAYVNKHSKLADNTTRSYVEDIMALARKAGMIAK